MIGDQVSLIRQVKSEFDNTKIIISRRKLTENEISYLEKNGNSSANWLLVYLQSNSLGCDNVQDDGTLSRIKNCKFCGQVVIGTLSGTVETAYGIHVSSGLVNTYFENCVLESDCFISNNVAIKNAYICSKASIIDCGYIVADTVTSFSNGEYIAIGPETGGRKICTHIGLRYDEICCLALSRNDNESNFKSNTVASQIKADMSIQACIISENVKLFRCDLIRCCFIGESAEVTSSTLDGCHLVSTKATPVCVLMGSALSNCILHPGCSVGPRASADHTLLLEFAGLGEGCKVEHSVLAPDASVAGGECLHCLVGPFVGMHHQSLLIATIWPLGRGNIGYGAMVGANHTGRVNDQECLIGEGCFFGLGVAVKFPFNCLASPYSIFTTGASCLPQRVAFPFSLVSTQDCVRTDVPPMFTVIKPAWVLYANPYMIERAGRKFIQRRRAKAHTTSFAVVRPSVVSLCVSARERLVAVKPTAATGASGTCVMYTERDVEGLGKSVLSESDRQLAIESYSDFIRRFALHGLLKKVGDLGSNQSALKGLLASLTSVDENDNVLAAVTTSPVEAVLSELNLFAADSEADFWDYQRALLRTEFSEELKRNFSVVPTWSVLRVLLAQFVSLENRYRASVLDCRKKDDERGIRVIPDYDLTHAPAECDAVVIDVARECDENIKNVNALLVIIGLWETSEI